MKTVLITNIQRFSLNDGPGIRTTVFFQGCNMRCAWCHNPETLPMRPVLMRYDAKCIGCGKCLTVCPQHAHKIVDGIHRIDRALCTGCGICADHCFASALVMSSHPHTVDDVMREIRQDKLYYERSGGGVTLSGGEATLHADFAAALADRCHAEGIPIAIETNMALPFHALRPVLEKMDLILCDIKHMDTIAHRQWTGVDTQIILNNIGRASLLGIPMVVRTPLIPGVNDSVENIDAIAAYVAKLKHVLYYELLNFNPLGGAKCAALERDDPLECARPFSDSALDALRAKLSATDLLIKIS